MYKSKVMRKKKKRNMPGLSYVARVADVVAIYDEHSRSGLSNREILRRYIWPKYFICERTFYNLINASVDERIQEKQKQLTFDF